MTRGKRKQAKKKVKARRVLYVALFATCLVSCAFLLSHLLSEERQTPGNPLLFEEIYSIPTKLQKKIGKIDRAIYESFYRNKIRDNDVVFLSVQPRLEDGQVWDATELMVLCPSHAAALGILEDIRRHFTLTDREIHVGVYKSEEQKIFCRIYVGKSYTHEIVLTFSSHPFSPSPKRPKIAMIVDDLGYDVGTAQSFLKSGLPFSYSVLPRAPFTQDIVKMAKKGGCELLAHLPMEPKNYPRIDPGPGALLIHMNEKEIRKRIDEDLERIPGARGVNNHMGSSFTENADCMRSVLGELKRKGLFYIDSRTTDQTVGADLARKLGLPTASRDVFVDNDLAPEAIEMQMVRLFSLARHSGQAIGIVHPHRESLKVIKGYFLKTKIRNGFEAVRVSKLVH